MIAPAFSIEADAFFAQLPRGRLDIRELRLIAALRECAIATEDLGLPPSMTLQQWAARRDPGFFVECKEFLQVVTRQEATVLQPRAENQSGTVMMQNYAESQQPTKKRRPRMESQEDREKLRQENEKLRQSKSCAFFESLPQDAFTGEELALREALLNFLHLKLQADQGYPPAVYECSGSKGDPKITARCRNVLPSGVAFRDWIDYRLGGEAGTSWDLDRQCTVVSLVDDAIDQESLQNAGNIGNGEDETVVQFSRSTRKRPRSQDPAARELRELQRQEAHDRFFASLPADEFTPVESRLRLALLNFLREYELMNPGWPPSVAEANSRNKGNPLVHELCRTLLPTGVGLREWINERIGSEVQAVWDEERQCSVLYEKRL